MQKTKKQARRAKAGKTGSAGNAGSTGSTGNTRTAGKTGKTTEAQRIAKRRRDRKYREKVRMAKEMAETLRPGADAGSSCTGPTPSVQDVFSLVGRLVLQELAKEEGIPRQLRPPTSPEPGVTCQLVSLPDGRTATLTVVDVDAVDPLSERSTIPEPIRMHLLRQRMAREISDIVDSHLELS